MCKDLAFSWHETGSLWKVSSIKVVWWTGDFKWGSTDWGKDYRRVREKQENQLGGDGCLDQSGSNEGRLKRLHSGYTYKKIDIIGFPGRLEMAVWDTGAKVFFICSCVCVCLVALCDPMDCGPPGSSVHEILQARVLEWVAISFSRGSFTPRNQTRVSRTAGRFFTDWALRESLRGALTPNTKHIHTSAHFPFTPLTSLHPTQVAIQCTLSLNMALWQSSVVK